MKDRFESLESGEVISVQQDTPVLSGQHTFRVGELNDAITKQLASAIEGWNEAKSAWLSPNGIDCEALRFGSNGWQKGRIRLCLEFCPDEPSPAAESASHNFVPTATATAPLSHVATSNDAGSTTLDPVAHETPAVVLPVAEVAVGTVAAAAVMAATLPPVATVPHMTDVVLLPEDDLAASTDRHVEGMDEISFEFAANNGDRQGKIVPDGMMELDLTDLDLDRAEHDYLNFETTGMSDLPELDRSKNSGVLIDEVWNEISQQPSWPGIH